MKISFLNLVEENLLWLGSTVRWKWNQCQVSYPELWMGNSHWLSRFVPLQMAFRSSYLHLRHIQHPVLSLPFVWSACIEFLKSAQQAVNDAWNEWAEPCTKGKSWRLAAITALLFPMACIEKMHNILHRDKGKSSPRPEVSIRSPRRDKWRQLTSF